MAGKSPFEQQYQDAIAQFSERKPNEPSAAPPPEAADLTKPKPKPPSMFTEVEENVPESWVRFSKVFGFAPPSGNDRRGPVFEANQFPDNLRAFIPKKIAGYFMPQEETESLWHAHIDNDVVWLHGQSGTGKSSLEEQFAAFIGQPFLRFNGREDIESSALFGQLTVEGEGTVWKDGLLTEGVKYGARTLMDEATAIPAGIWMGVQWLLEKDGKLMLTDKPAEAGERLVDPDPRFRLTFADNTRGQGDDDGAFTGTGVMNTATLNRVGLTIEIKWLHEADEFEVLKAKHGDRVNERVLKDVINLATLLRKAGREHQLSLAFSLRTIDSMLRKAYNYRTQPVKAALEDGFAEAYANLLPNDEEQGAALNLFEMTFGSY